MSATPTPQKFKRGNVVRVADHLGPSMSHFRAGADAVVIGSYRDQFGCSPGSSSYAKSNTSDYTIMFLDTGDTVSWYHEHQLTLLSEGGEFAIAREPGGKPRSWKREHINPLGYLKRMHGINPAHIEYDPKLRRGDYNITRGTNHDGTLLFTYELLDKTLAPVVDKSSFCKLREAEFMAAKDVRYIVGPLRLYSVSGIVDLPCGRVPGQRERTSMPVRVIEIAGVSRMVKP